MKEEGGTEGGREAHHAHRSGKKHAFSSGGISLQICGKDARRCRRVLFVDLQSDTMHIAVSRFLTGQIGQWSSFWRVSYQSRTADSTCVRTRRQTTDGDEAAGDKHRNRHQQYRTVQYSSSTHTPSSGAKCRAFIFTAVHLCCVACSLA